MPDVRVRFAPSPTGFFHIGSARTALFNWLYARHTGGTFILRIEDTDSERNTDESLRSLYDGLRWLGLDWDEGPEREGACGPYFQSQRGSIYAQHIDQLLAKGRAYEHEGAIFLKLEGPRERVFDKYRNAEVEKVVAEPVEIHDAIRGLVRHPVEADFVLRRSNGDYGFHFTNVVDDITMAITHVIRGEDHLTNTARHIRLFEAFGVKPPVYAHLPLILKGDGKGKMSKREPGAGLYEHVENGILPQALRNFLCLLGWNPKNEKEKMPIEEIIERFDLDGINKDGARFDNRKLAALNTEYLRELPTETFSWIATPYLIKSGTVTESTPEDYLHHVMSLVQEKTRDLPGLPELCGFFFTEDFKPDEAARQKVFKNPQAAERLRQLLPELENLPDEQWKAASLEALIEDHAQRTGTKKFDAFPILRFALSGQSGGPDLMGCLAVLGKANVLKRARKLLESVPPA